MQENTTSNSAPKERRKARQNRSGAHSIGSNIAYLLKNIARRYPALLFMMAVEIAAGVAAPAFGIYLPKLAADLALGETAFAPARAALYRAPGGDEFGAPEDEFGAWPRNARGDVI